MDYLQCRYTTRIYIEVRSPVRLRRASGKLYEKLRFTPLCPGYGHKTIISRKVKGRLDHVSHLREDRMFVKVMTVNMMDYSNHHSAAQNQPEKKKHTAIVTIHHNS